MHNSLDRNRIKTLFSEQNILQQIEKISTEIEKDYCNQPDLLVLIVMKGAFLFGSDILKRLKLNVRVEFIEISSYGERGTTPGKITIVKEPNVEFNNQHILIIEDIIDTGQTADFLHTYLMKKKPASLNWCVLLQKPNPPENVIPKYVAFQAPDKFLIGYGLDYKELYRNLPYIGYIESFE